LLDPLSARGHKIPPNVARTLQGGAAEEHETRAPRCSYRNSVSGTEDQKPRAFEIAGGEAAFDIGVANCRSRSRRGRRLKALCMS
jgi:hypothetical protein